MNGSKKRASELRVVLADDHELVRSGLRALLESAGVSVVGEARNGLEAIEAARQLSPDVVVMDVSMPGMDGIAATETISRELAHVKVLALTAHDDRAHVTRLLRVGASGYLLKRAAAQELVHALHVIAEGGTYVDPALAATILRAQPSAGAVEEPRDEPTAPLSAREEEVLRSLAWGRSNKEIATMLEVSTKTVETYRTRLCTKLGLRTRTDMVRYAVGKGWLSQE